MAPDAPLLAVSDVYRAFGDHEVLRGVDLQVDDGEIVAVLGPSGGGKTTLLRLVAGFDRPNRGSISLRGTVVSSPSSALPPEKRHVSIVPQEGALFPHLDVRGNVAFGLSARWRRSNRPAIAARVAECLELVGLEGRERAKPHELSGGQQQRVALARALAPNPSLVMLDEPFSSLDQALRAQVRSEVAGVLKASGCAAVIVTHDQREALSMADRVAVLLDGRIAQVASPTALYKAPVSVEVATFVGDATLVPGSRLGQVADTPLGVVRLTGPDGPDGVVSVVVRPEQLTVSSTESTTAVAAHVASVTFLGHSASVSLDFDGLAEPVLARLSGVELPEVGEKVWVSVVGCAVAFSRSSA